MSTLVHIRQKLISFDILAIVVMVSLLILCPVFESLASYTDILIVPLDSTDKDSIDLLFPLKEDRVDNYGKDKKGKMYLEEPSNVKGEFVYDPATGNYIYKEKMGDRNYRNPNYLTLEEYLDYDMSKNNRDYWREKSAQEDETELGFRPKLYVEGKAFDRIFGGNTIDIRPTGSAELSFGINVSRRDNPAIPERQRRTSTFDFNEKIQLNLVGKVGDKLKITTSYNTEATFDFENQTKIEYTGYEDEIIQKIELGNVALPLNGSLISGSQTLFGVKTALRFGRLTVTSIFSQERGERKEINVAGGAQITKFEKSASEYEENRHYFLGHFFRDRYEAALSNLPLINSNIQITKVEVWVSTQGQQINNSRNVVAFTDLGEHDSITSPQVNPRGVAAVADNNANDLYRAVADSTTTLGAGVRSYRNATQVLGGLLNFRNGDDFEVREGAVLLSASEYTVNTALGYISLNRTLQPDDILGVAYQYTLNGRTYQVGEFSNQGVQGQDALYLKLLKGTKSNSNTKQPIWNLMMKNVYSLGAFNVAQEDFAFEIWYLNPETGVEVPFIPEGAINGKLLLQVMNLDKLDPNNAPHPDGFFDFIPGTTINPSNGKIYFPVLEPFGSHLRRQFQDPALADKYVFDSLYSTTRALAELDADKNRYVIKGQYQSSSSSEISLNSFNIPQGSVVVTAGGIRLIENQDYTVDYNLGRVKILNDGLLESGTPIKISLESNSLFNIQTRTLVGTRFDYKVDEEFSFGGTILNLTERPLTRKINVGDESISNTIWGLDATYTSESPFLTRMVDKIPLISTKEKSRVTATVEFAHLIPGNARAITKQGVSYIDDFEGSQSQIDLKTPLVNWKLASTPQGQPDLFPEGDIAQDSLAYGFNRAKLAWYVVDPLFWRDDDNRKPDNIDETMQSDHRMREILQTEVFPNRDQEQNLINNIPVFDLAYYPTQRGPYNYVPPQGQEPLAAGLTPEGDLIPDERRWAGIMRDIQTNDFEATNVEFIQFWVMDPFNEDNPIQNHSGGRLYFNLGLVSEDILKDGQKSFENGFPWSENLLETDTTIWGRVPASRAIITAFDNNPEARDEQDIGLDGLEDQQERNFFSNYLNNAQSVLTPQGYEKLLRDPSADNFRYFRDENDNRNEDILERYADYNGHENNSPTGGNGSFTPAFTTLPDIEDVNRDNNLSLIESYFQYSVPITRQVFDPDNVGNNYITDVLEVSPQNANGKSVRWYQFKIPIRSPEKRVGNIQDFRSVQFMRMFLKGFEQDIVLRFARLDLVRGEWRKYNYSLVDPGQYLQNEEDETPFVVGAVNVEENRNRRPVNYVIPPGIEREVDFGTANLRRLNEQSLSLDVCDLQDGDARAVYRNMDLDVRQYKRLKMFVHAEAGVDDRGQKVTLNDGDVSAFVRIGTDFDDNYYEYEIPLEVTDWVDLQGSITDPDRIWPSGNDMDIEFSKLINAKVQRDGLKLPLTAVYTTTDGNRTIRVKGNPTLSEVKVFMIGIKNPRQGVGVGDRPDDGLPKCAEIWVNELRLSDFRNEGGWAANALVSAQLADLGSMNLAGSMSTPGFGSIEQKLNERQQETRQQYDFSSNIELGRFAQDVVSVPMFFSYSESWVKPRYNPLSPDIEFDEVLRSDEYSKSQKDSIKRATIAYTQRKSINFTNVKKLPSKNKKNSHAYDPENISLTYSYSEVNSRDIQTEFDNRKQFRGIVAYNYTAKPKNYKPLDNISFLKRSKHLKIIRDFNFYLLPKQYTIQNTIDRDYRERKVRQTTPFFNPQPYYQKQFNWMRTYSLRYDITKSLRFNFQADNRSIIEETTASGGRVDKRYKEEYDNWKDTVYQSVRDFGVNMAYHHNFTLNYTLPINKILPLDWVSVNTRYSGDYFWDRAPIGFDTLGNSIRNSNTFGVNTDLNMVTLYNKVDYLKRLNQKKTKKDEVRMLKREKKEDEQNNQNALVKKADAEEEDEKDRKLNIIDHTALVLMGVKSVSANYNRTAGTVLPGYSRGMNVLGFDNDFNAPGFGFITGAQQDTNFVKEASEQGWLVQNRSGLVRSFSNTYTETYNFRITIRPVPDLNIDLNATYNYATDAVRGFFYNDADSLPEPRMEFFNPVETGSFSMSFLSYKTAFVKDAKGDNSSATFEQLLANRSVISRRLGEEDTRSSGKLRGSDYYDGYNGVAQEVLIGAFVSAYSKEDPEKVSVIKDFWKQLPKPNWRVTYDGLSKVEFFKKYVRSFTISHGYRSSYNVNSFTTNLLLQDDNGNLITKDSISGNFIPRYQISAVSITEQFSPLIGFDVKWKIGFLDNWGTKIEFKRDRNVTLSLANNQVTEVRGKEVVVGVNKTFPNFKFPFGNKKREGKSLTTRVDVSSRNNVTVIRRIVEADNQAGGGQRIISIKFTADYAVSTKLNIRAFYDRIVTTPFISNSFPTANTNAGVAIRFSLTQ